jgi:hypothetical protein
LCLCVFVVFISSPLGDVRLIITPVGRIANYMLIQKTKLRITQTRRTTIELSAFHLPCPYCQGDVIAITPSQAATLLGVDRATFEQLMVEGRVHTLQTVMGQRLICTASLIVY